MDGLISSSKNAHLSSLSRKPSVGEQNQAQIDLQALRMKK